VINHANDLILVPQLTRELLCLYRKNPHWLTISAEGGNEYRITLHESIALLGFLPPTGRARALLLALSTWIGQGPKIARPSVEQCRALEQVEVRLSLDEYTQPYPVLAVDLPDGLYPPFRAVLLQWLPETPCLGVHVFSTNLTDDISTMIRKDGKPLEASLSVYDATVESHLVPQCLKLQRAAVNLALAMSHFGSTAEYLLPNDVSRDRTVARKHAGTPKGKAAQERLPLHVKLVEFRHDVELFRAEPGVRLGAVGSGGEKGCHWRRGHWRMQPCGLHHAERRRIFIKPILVRADLFVGDVSDTTTVYQHKEKPHE